MERKNIIRWILGLVSPGLASAYGNDSMTSDYLQLVNNNPIEAIINMNTTLMGDWFWILMVAGPYLGLWIYQRSIHMATLWLTFVLVAYGGFIMTGYTPTWAFYIMVAAWVGSVLIRVFSPKWTE